MRIRPPLALALLMAATPCGAQDAASARLGRLFTTPAERAALNDKRALGPAAPMAARMAPAEPPGAPPPPDAAAPAEAAGPGAVRLDGVLRVSSGRTTIWINQTAAAAPAPLGRDKSVTLRLSSGRKLIMKPGQSYSATDGTVQESAQR